MKDFISVVVAVSTLIVALSSAIPAQCPGDDGFAAGVCCTPAASNVPNFPTMTVGGLGACLLNCSVENQFNTQATLAPTQVLCDYWLINLAIVAPTFTVGTPAGSIPLVAKYSRTWTEFAGGAAGGPTLQVWRFLVNGDLIYGPSTGTAGGCPIPLSAQPPYNLPVHFIGNVDYALDCATGLWQIAYTLSHFCPPESHAPFSQRPIAAAAGWPKRTYHFVGPANFVFGGLCPAPTGAIIAESERTSLGLLNPAIPYTCLHETQVFQGNLQTVNLNCACTDPTPVAPPPRYSHQTLMAFENCAGVGAPILSFGGLGIPFMPTGLRALTIGSWVAVTSSTYPGTKCVSLYLGILDSPGLCGPAAPGPALHAVSGIGTTGGNPVMLFSSTLPAFFPLKFLDLQNMLVLTPFGFTPGFGSVFASERVWNLNMM